MLYFLFALFSCVIWCFISCQLPLYPLFHKRSLNFLYPFMVNIAKLILFKTWYLSTLQSRASNVIIYHTSLWNGMETLSILWRSYPVVVTVTVGLPPKRPVMWSFGQCTPFYCPEQNVERAVEFWDATNFTWRNFNVLYDIRKTMP